MRISTYSRTKVRDTIKEQALNSKFQKVNLMFEKLDPLSIFSSFSGFHVRETLKVSRTLVTLNTKYKSERLFFLTTRCFTSFAAQFFAFEFDTFTFVWFR